MNLSFTNPIIEKEWNLSKKQLNLIISLYFAGYLFGNIVSGKIGDKVGRKSPVIWSNLMIFIFGISSCMVNNFINFILIKFFFGFFVGILTPVSKTALGEITRKIFN